MRLRTTIGQDSTKRTMAMIGLATALTLGAGACALPGGAGVADAVDAAQPAQPAAQPEPAPAPAPTPSTMAPRPRPRPSAPTTTAPAPTTPAPTAPAPSTPSAPTGTSGGFGGGPTGPLSPYTGPDRITGGVIENVRITKPILIQGNVVMRNVEIVTSEGFYVLNLNQGSLVLEDFRIDGHGGAEGRGGLVGTNLTARRGEIVGVENGIVGGSNQLIEDVYIHDLEGNGHADGLQYDGNNDNITLRRVRSEATSKNTSALMIDNHDGPSRGFVIDNCRFSGGMYAMYLDGQFTSNPLVVTSISGTDFSNGVYGAVLKRGPVTIGTQTSNTSQARAFTA